ncbi:Lecithin-cholesterol acyltransferase-like 1 [Dichanthelium oligosanthes]|uniref:Lecithin-cholesterol acyltransferase-like 1 n=1 Tax=Dichanthelium oligosanthes TaxID=888268 RepID=A0A1E5V861_9POAL|nr:Lecithin-cholesterol acyltransferase-like 1 [Dichanthelium oligosanthes]
MAISARLRWAAALLLVPAVAAILSKHLSSRRGRQLPLPPVVVVPGYATNELDARLTELYRPSSPCCAARKGQGWFRLYLNYTALEDPAEVRCFAEQISAAYDAVSDDYRNAMGVETRVPFFGSTRGFRYPDPDRRNFSYMDRFVSRLEGIGYRDGETLFGAPYDFRYAVAPPGHPSSVGTAFFRRLKGLVERASRINGGRPVTIVAHSYGGTLAYQFLLRQPLPWRRRFVRRFVPVAAPWGGVVLGMLTLVAGNNLGLRFVDPLALKGAYRSLQSSLWPLPSPSVFGAAQPLVTTRSRTYTANDMPDFLEAIGMGAAVGPYESRVLPLFRELPSPRVPVACVVGVGVDTPEMLAYPGDGFDVAPRMVMGDGDGLVNLASLVAVDRAWRRHAALVKVRNVSHTGLHVDDRALAVVITAILLPN